MGLVRIGFLRLGCSVSMVTIRLPYLVTAWWLTFVLCSQLEFPDILEVTFLVLFGVFCG